MSFINFTKLAGIRDELGLGSKTLCENCKMFTDEPTKVVGAKGWMNLCPQCYDKMLREQRSRKEKK